MSVASVTVIEVRRLVKRYGGFQALHGINLEVSRGEVFGFIGPNGAGKTTLIRTALDLIRPSEGEVRVFGLDSRRDAIRIHALTGYVPGELALWDRLNGRQALAHLSGLRGGAGADRIDGLAERLQVELDRRISDLSKGNREKIGLIQGFMHEPDLVILDEPTSGLDPLIQQEVFAIVDEFKERGATVFFSSHHLDEVERIADRVGAIREGRMVAVDTVAGLKARAARRVEVLFGEPVAAEEFTQMDGVREVRVSGRHLHMTVGGAIDPVLKAIARHRVESLSAPEPELEEVFLGLYRGSAEPMLGSVVGRGLFEQRRALIGWSLGTAALVLVTVAYYPSVRDNPELNSFYESLPDAVQALSGGVGLDFASATGYLTSQLFAITVPIIFIIYGVLLGAAAVGREEDRGTAELLLTAPISRRRVIGEKALAATALLSAVGIALFASLLLGDLRFDMHVSAANLLAASLASSLIGTTFGALALAISGALGHRAHPAAWSGSAAVASYLLYSLAPVVSSLQTWQKASPFYWYLASDPVANGFKLGHLAVLAAASVVLTIVAAVLFDRRDVAS